MVLVFAIIGAGCASAETFRQGGSTATIHQSGGGKSASRVTRYRDGQKMITRDGRSTDITIQRGKRGPPPRMNQGYPTTGIDRFERWFAWERFPSINPNGYGGGADCPKGGLSVRDAFKQRMLDRLRGY